MTTPAKLNELVDGENILLVSGGKDSTAMYLYALEQGVEGFRAVFSDVGNEHEATLEFVDTLSGKTGGPEVEVIRADLSHMFENRRNVINTKWRKDGIPEDVIERALKVMHPTGNPFLDGCLLNGGFPTSAMRWCTNWLKMMPTYDQIYRPLWEERKLVVAWQGVRRDESPRRAQLPVTQTLDTPSTVFGRSLPPVRRTSVYRPILDWDLSKVFSMHHRHGIEPNPLYRKGMTRVGCMPCIMVNEGELRVLGKEFPEHVDKIEEWEEVMSQAHRSRVVPTFLLPARFVGAKRIKTVTINHKDHGIRAAVEAATRKRTGGEMDLFGEVGLDHKPELTSLDEGAACDNWGACE